MIFGTVIRPIALLIVGVAAFSLALLQMFVGYRKIRFKGRMHPLMHRRIAWVLIAVAALHGLMGLIFATGLQLG
jgi:hypothetical protein